MEVEKILHMVGGSGETSYANNSSLPRVAMSKVKPIIEKAIFDLCSSIITKSLGIGDLGCSSGPNTFLAISEIIDAIDGGSRRLKRPVPELHVFLNDLPSNDFNSISQSLPAFYEKLRKDDFKSSCFVAAVPGSFYGRLFPTRSLHFVHSSYSLQWLSRVPPGISTISGPSIINKGNIYLTETSPPSVHKAYLEQFRRDFRSFLRSRSEEIVPGGRMVLTFLGRTTADPSSKEACYIWKLLGQALHHLVLKGLIEEAKLESFNMPYYAASGEELKEVVEKEGSFELNHLDTIQICWDGSHDYGSSFDEVGLKTAKIMRAVAEPLLVSHFGVSVMDQVFQRYGEIVAHHLASHGTKHVNLVVSLTRRC